ncbi:MAG TPA: polysaccharide deacetylase family protein [Sporichthya sp.]|nr:polysaccharide deacetylase family protein [Sporichthya sp.]
MDRSRGWRWGASVAIAVALAGAATPGARAGGAGAAERRDIDCRVVRCVAITFDDGPGLYIDKLLAALDDAGARATFFVLGDVVADRPSALRKIAAAGHEIGDHTWNHRELPAMSDAEIRAELTRTANLVQSVTGRRPELMRPPYGEVSERVVDVLGARQWPIIQWSVDPEDWKDRNADTVYRRVIAGTHPGSIVLLHDIHATTVAAVPRILAALADRGYTFVTVSELYGGKLSAGVQYFTRNSAYVGKRPAPGAKAEDATD